jgi:DNA-binding NtrC family response regulator
MSGQTDGMGVFACQQSVSPGTPCILVTAFGSSQVQQEAERLNVAYLEKPILLGELLEKIRTSITPAIS